MLRTLVLLLLLLPITPLLAKVDFKPDYSSVIQSVVEIKRGDRFVCRGSIISRNRVQTAGHCILRIEFLRRVQSTLPIIGVPTEDDVENVLDVAIAFSKQNLFLEKVNEEGQWQDLKIKDILLAASYRKLLKEKLMKPNSETTYSDQDIYANDLATIEIEPVKSLNAGPINTKSFVGASFQPDKVWMLARTNMPNNPAIEFSQASSGILLMPGLYLVPLEFQSIDNKKIYVGSWGQGACPSESGGPLYVISQEGQFSQVGVISLGTCGVSDNDILGGATTVVNRIFPTHLPN